MRVDRKFIYSVRTKVLIYRLKKHFPIPMILGSSPKPVKLKISPETILFCCTGRPIMLELRLTEIPVC